MGGLRELEDLGHLPGILRSSRTQRGSQLVDTSNTAYHVSTSSKQATTRDPHHA